MASGSRICPHCGGLNAADEARCHRCGRKLPGAVGGAALDAVRGVVGTEFLFNKLYLAICIAVFGLCIIGNGGLPKQFLFGGFRPSEYLRWGAFSNEIREEFWRYLSAMFVHGGVLHLVLNMLALGDLGRAVESRLGGSRFVFVFVITGIVGFIVSDAWSTLVVREPLFTVGASGGLFGLMGAIIGFLFARRDPEWKALLVRFALYAAIFAFAARGASISVNNSAHIGGFVCGALIGFLFEKERRPREHERLFASIAWAFVILSLLSIGLSARSRLWQDQRRYELERESVASQQVPNWAILVRPCRS